MTRGEIVLYEKKTYYPKSSRWTICQREWNAKWNRICAIIVGILLFIGLMGIAFNEVVLSNRSRNTVDRGSLKFMDRSLLHSNRITNCYAQQCYYYGATFCCVNCNNCNLDYVNQMIDNFAGNNDCPQEVYLTMQNVNFPNKTMYKNWLGFSSPVRHLTMNGCDIVHIEADSFSADNFDNLKTITLINMKIPELNESMFNGLRGITDINLRAMHKNFKMHADFLQAFIKLETLQVQNSIYDSNVLTTFTGSEAFNSMNVQILDLSDNGLTTIPAYAFRSNSLLSLYMGRNMLSSIDDNAFQFARNIQLLQLANNKFKTLSDKPFLKMPKVKLFIEQNNWECDCSLESMKNLKIVDASRTQCSNGEFFDKYEFCPEEPESSVSTEIISSPSYSSSTESSSKASTFSSVTLSNPTDSITSSATDAPESTASSPTDTHSKPTESITSSSTDAPKTTSSSPTVTSKDPTSVDPSSPSTTTSRDYPDSSSAPPETSLAGSTPAASTTTEVAPGYVKELLCVKNQFENKLYKFGLNINMTAEDEGNGVIRMIVHTANVNPTKYDFLMIPSDASKNSCYMVDLLAGTPVILDGPSTLCMIDRDKHTLSSPFDCVPVRTRSQSQSAAWLQQEDKVPLISICVVIVLLVIGLTAVSMFFCIRQHPQMLKGNKRVVVVKNSRADVLVMPSRPQVPMYMKSPRMDVLEGNEYAPRRYTSRRDPEYLTPVISRNVCQRARPPLMRSLSDTSVKTIASYITENQIDMNYAARRNMEEIEVPPPLPPPRRAYSKYDFSNEVIVYKQY